LAPQEPFAAVVAPLELDLKSLAEDAQGVVIGVESAADDRGNHPLKIVVEQGWLKTLLPVPGSPSTAHYGRAMSRLVDPGVVFVSPARLRHA